MFRQLRYFQSVVRLNSFSEAAEENFISQSAVSQQIQALERELGFPLLVRKNRSFSLTPAGEYFYRKSLVLTADYDRICAEAAAIANGRRTELRIGHLRCYSGRELHGALELFAAKHPDVPVSVRYGNHEELYDMLRTDQADIVLNDQRRAFSDEYVNLVLSSCTGYAAVPHRSPLAQLGSVTPQELKNIPCILTASQQQMENEEEYYRSVIGIESEFLRAENLEEAQLMAISGRGCLLTESCSPETIFGTSQVLLPLMRRDEPIKRNYCAFRKRENSGYHIEEFTDILREQFG